MISHKLLLSTLICFAFANNNYLSLTTSIEANSSRAGAEFLSNIQFGTNHPAISLGVNLEQYIAQNLSCELRGESHLLNIAPQTNMWVFSSTFMPLYHVSPYNSIGAGIKLAHTKDSPFIYNLAYAVQIKTALSKTLYTSFELQKDASAQSTIPSIGSVPYPLQASFIEDNAYLASYGETFQDSVKITLGYTLLQNFDEMN